MLTIEAFAEAKGFAVETLQSFGVRQGKTAVEIPYFNMDGTEAPRHRLRTAIVAKEGSKWSAGESEMIPYGLNRPVPFDKGSAIIVEGETDCWALWADKKPALGLPGASNFKCLALAHVEGTTALYVVREPGEAGARFPYRVGMHLYDLGYTGTVYAISLDAKDPHDLWRKDPAKFGDSLRDSIRAREEIVRPVKAETKATGVNSLSALLAKPRMKLEYIIDGMLPVGGIMLTTAPPKAGKSVLMRNLALSVARGTPFLGREVRKGRVFWARLEEQLTPFIEDLVAMGAADCADSFFTNEEPAPSSDLNAWLAAAIEEHRPALVIVDTWQQFTRCGDLNNYAKVNESNKELMRFSRELGVAQVWIHHTKKGEARGGEAVLGSQALFGACDTLLSITRLPNESRTVQTTQRVGEAMEETPIVMDPDTHLITVSAARSAMRNGQIEDAILSELALAENGWMYQSVIVDEVGFRKTDVLSALASLEERQLITREEEEGRGNPIRVALVVRTTAISLAAYRERRATTSDILNPESEIESSVTESPETESLETESSDPVLLKSGTPPSNQRLSSQNDRLSSAHQRLSSAPPRLSSATPRLSSAPPRLSSANCDLVPTRGTRSADPASRTRERALCAPAHSALAHAIDTSTSVRGRTPLRGFLCPLGTETGLIFPKITKDKNKHPNTYHRFAEKLKRFCESLSNSISQSGSGSVSLGRAAWCGA